MSDDLIVKEWDFTVFHVAPQEVNTLNVQFPEQQIHGLAHAERPVGRIAHLGNILGDGIHERGLIKILQYFFPFIGGGIGQGVDSAADEFFFEPLQVKMLDAYQNIAVGELHDRSPSR